MEKGGEGGRSLTDPRVAVQRQVTDTFFFTMFCLILPQRCFFASLNCNLDTSMRDMPPVSGAGAETAPGGAVLVDLHRVMLTAGFFLRHCRLASYRLYRLARVLRTAAYTQDGVW